MATDRTHSEAPEQAVKRTGRTACVTSMPETPAPQIVCPTCDQPLVYRHTVLGGVNPLERWDYFECRTCGPFEYRERTRKLRKTADVPFSKPPSHRFGR